MHQKAILVILLCLAICEAHFTSNSQKITKKRSGASSCQKRALSACVLDPELTEGPYYIADLLIRQNITEGKPGLPFRLYVTVVDSTNCSVIPNAAVDMWHCDAAGIYSHFIAASQGGSTNVRDNSTFLRGVQMTDANGTAEIDTIYPGWYQGRALHMHVKVHINSTESNNTLMGGHVSHTGQFFINDSLTDEVAKLSPYNEDTVVRTRLTEDGIYLGGGSSGMLSYSYMNPQIGLAGGIIATIVVEVDPSSTPTVSNGGGPTEDGNSTFPGGNGGPGGPGGFGGPPQPTIFVWQDVNGDGLYTADEPAAQNIQIDVYNNGNYTQTVSTNSSGYAVVNFRPQPGQNFSLSVAVNLAQNNLTSGVRSSNNATVVTNGNITLSLTDGRNGVSSAPYFFGLVGANINLPSTPTPTPVTAPVPTPVTAPVPTPATAPVPSPTPVTAPVPSPTPVTAPVPVPTPVTTPRRCRHSKSSCKKCAKKL